MTAPYYDAHGATLHAGDCLDILRTLPDASVDAVVTDPPYGLEFMGKEWDSFKGTPAAHADARTRRAAELDDPSKGKFIRAGVNAYEAGAPFQQWCTLWAAECLRVLKPGGHLLAFGGTRTWHRLACAIEDAGFEVRDSIAWMYGSGFPKSLDVSKAIDKAAGAIREVVGTKSKSTTNSLDSPAKQREQGYRPDWHNERLEAPTVQWNITAPATPEAARWAGWGTALKPAFEPIVVARKPLTGTVAANVLAHGTGALNIDGCRIGMSDADAASINAKHAGMDAATYDRPVGVSLNLSTNPMPLKPAEAHTAGRWPANVVLDDHAAAALDAQSGESGGGFGRRGSVENTGDSQGMFGIRATGEVVGYGDTGGASRFFYTAKADATERPRVNGTAHPTVKPLDLMRWLVRLVTPPGGIVLEPFAGSGTTVEACLLEGFQCIAIEREADYLPLIVARITRQRDPVAHVRLVGDEHLTLFDDATEAAQ